MKVLARLHFFPEFQGQNLSPCLFSFQRMLVFFAPSIFKASNNGSSPSQAAISLVFYNSQERSFSFNNLCDLVGSTWKIQVVSSLATLMPSATLIPFCLLCSIFTGLRIRGWASLGAIVLLLQSKRNENICPYKDLYSNVHSSFIH